MSELCLRRDGAVRPLLDPARAADLVSVPGLDEAALQGAGLGAAHVRGVLRGLVVQGRRPVLVVPAPGAGADGEAALALLTEAARLDVASGGAVTVRVEGGGGATEPWAQAAAALLTGAVGLDTLDALAAAWRARFDALPDGADKNEGERLLRRIDDRRRKVVFGLVERARRGVRDPERPLVGWPGAPPSEADATAAAEARLGDKETWLRPFARFASEETPRLVVIPTWQCELRCRYCFIPKQDGRVMPVRTLERAVDLLLASDHPDVILQFFGGEAMVEWDLVRHGVAYAQAGADRVGKTISFILSSNGWSISPERLAWLGQFQVKLELSLDGDRWTQNRFRRALQRGADSYAEGIPDKRDMIAQSGLRHEVIMVVHPEAAPRMPDNFFHVVDLGFPRVQINFGLGFRWTTEQMRTFASGLQAIGAELRRRWAEGEDVMLINLEGAPMPVRLNGEVTVDWDGTVYGGNGFLHETKHKDRFVVGHLDDLGGFDRYWLDTPDNGYLLAWSYPEDVTANNRKVGAIMASFIRHMRAGGLGPRGGRGVGAAAPA